MKIRGTFNTPVIIVTTALIVILPVLAYMQYIWLGQVSNQEFRRMQDNVRTAAFHCSMEFTQEITGLIKSLGGPTSGSESAVQATLCSRILKWKSSVIHSAIVSPEITFSPMPSPNHTVRIDIDGESMVLLFNNLSAIAVPLRDESHQAAIVFLDTFAIHTSLIPEIIQANLSSTLRDEYDIVVLNQNKTVVYGLKGTSRNAVLENADVAIPFLILPPASFSFFPFNRLNRGEFPPKFDDQPNQFDRNPQVFKGRSEFSPPREDMLRQEKGMGNGVPALFELRLKHHAGSLEAAVNNNRLRNLAISFGILLLLGTSMIFLLLSTNRAQRLAQQQLEFVASVSHELRTPLAVLKSAGENLADGVIQGQDRSRQYGELIKKEVIRLSEMVEKALVYAGIQSGNQTFELQPLRITDVITEAVRSTKKIVLDDCPIEVNIQENLPTILANAAALQSALENLLINAIKYIGEKKWVGIEVRSIEHTKHPSLEIVVKDTGIGIAPSDIAYVFKPFYRGHNAVDRQIEGSGLGLSITKHIVEAHGGTITVKSSLNNGTIITIKLPTAKKEGEKK